MRACLLIAALALSGCAAVRVQSDAGTVTAIVLGSAAIATGCPATARPEQGGNAQSGAVGVDPASPCAAVQGGPLSSAAGTALGVIGGAILRGGVP